MGWTYRVVPLPVPMQGGQYPPRFPIRLNVLGEKGWEIIGVAGHPPYAVLKKRLWPGFKLWRKIKAAGQQGSGKDWAKVYDMTQAQAAGVIPDQEKGPDPFRVWLETLDQEPEDPPC